MTSTSTRRPASAAFRLEEVDADSIAILDFRFPVAAQYVRPGRGGRVVAGTGWSGEAK